MMHWLIELYCFCAKSELNQNISNVSLDYVCVMVSEYQDSKHPIGRFSEAGLLEWMRFVIFRARSRERSQRTSGPVSE